ncbi:TlpA family protein disulfide reductase [Aquimarina algicola]|uniref:TlpA family protein disulfide reductase n=1 Tax=Aquimarina algicola TaxID=2589995 RepID=A0A504J0T6_9FLAO|nr:TlpA disulfide reductase family protein [Aquimarina algicola]TPN84446.1 TlpA family protein disulfide reductase [Aquimarina algicola]
MIKNKNKGIYGISIAFTIVIILSIYTIVDLSLSLKDTKAQLHKLSTKEHNPIDHLDTNSQEPQIPAPEIKAKDKNGNTFGLAQLSKKKKILVFAENSCEHCEAFYPELDAFAKAYGAFEVIVVKANTTVQDIKKTQEDKNYHFTLTSGDLQTFAEYQIDSTPTTFLLDEHNHIIQIAEVSTKRGMEEMFLTI